MPDKRLFRSLVGLGLGLGLILRLVAINQSLWLDEAISVLAARDYSLDQLVKQFMVADFNPPLFNLILFFWLKLVPATEFFVRLPSLVFGLLTGWLTFKIYQQVYQDDWGALAALLLLATSGLHLYYSQEARMYSLAAFGVSASVYWFIRLLKEKKAWLVLAYALATAVMVYSHYLAWLVLVVQWLFFFRWSGKGRGEPAGLIRARRPASQSVYQQQLPWSWLGLANILVLFLLLPWLPVFLDQLNTGLQAAASNQVWSQVVGGLSFKSVLLLPVKFIIGRTAFANRLTYFLTAFSLVTFYIYLLWHAWQSEAEFKGLIFGWLFLPPVLALLISFKVPVFSYFRFLYCLPALYILAVNGARGFKRPARVIGFLILVNLFFSGRYLLIEGFHRENWRSAVSYLRQHNQANAPVLILAAVAAPFEYYDQGESPVYHFDQKQSLVDSQAVWLVPYAQPIFDPQDQTREFLKGQGYQRVKEQHFNRVTVEKWLKQKGENNGND